MAAHHYVCVLVSYIDEPLDYTVECMVYHNHHKKIAAPHCMQAVVHSEYSAKREEITQKNPSMKRNNFETHEQREVKRVLVRG
jgi:hypothetical protein